MVDKEKNNEGKTERKTMKFFINNNKQNENVNNIFKNNKVRLAKYNLITFLPQALVVQFMRLANVYFLIVAVIQSIPLISPLTPVTAVGPLLFVLLGSLIREGWEDYKRHEFDNQLNNELVIKLHHEKWEEVKSKDLLTGEVIILQDGDVCPADIVILDSTFKDGHCFIETSNLDGEKTLKKRLSNSLTIGSFKNKSRSSTSDEKEEDYKQNGCVISGEVVCDIPNFELYKFDGKADIQINSQNIMTVSYSQKNILLKGSKIKNTKWVVGFIVYVGHDTKLIKNTKNPKTKISRIETLISKCVVGILLFQVILCISSAIKNTKYYTHNVEKNPYLPRPLKSIEGDGAISYFTYMMLLNTMVPISLIITLELVKIMQGYFMLVDAGLYSKKKRIFPKIGSVSINEELGQVTHIFSDKTGTLTDNKMKFRYCIIGKSAFQMLESNEIQKLKETKEKIENENENNEENIETEKGKEKFSSKDLRDIATPLEIKNFPSNNMIKKSSLKKGYNNDSNESNANSKMKLMVSEGQNSKFVNMNLKNELKNNPIDKLKEVNKLAYNEEGKNKDLLLLNKNESKQRNESPVKDATICNTPKSDKSNKDRDKLNEINTAIQSSNQLPNPIALVSSSNLKSKFLSENIEIRPFNKINSNPHLNALLYDKEQIIGIDNETIYLQKKGHTFKAKSPLMQEYPDVEKELSNNKSKFKRLKTANYNPKGWEEFFGQTPLSRHITIKNLEQNFKEDKDSLFKDANLMKIGEGFMSNKLRPSIQSTETKNKYMDFIIQSADACESLSLVDESNLIYNFWLALTLANECIVEKIKNKDGKIIPNEFDYTGMSPDDIELVRTSSKQGFQLCYADHNQKLINLNYGSTKIQKTFKVLQVIEFTSFRKCMSIIIQDEEDRIIMFSKGADTVIMSKLHKYNIDDILEENVKYSANFSKQGYRTLSVAMKILSKREYQKFESEYKQANLVMDNRQKAETK